MTHTTVVELLAAWDAGDTIWSIELGGLGPGYEQAIQVAAIEMARKAKDWKPTGDDKADNDSFTALCDEAIKSIDDQLLGLSGAQFGAARWLAHRWIVEGPAHLMERARADKRDTIQVSNQWPVVSSRGRSARE